MTGDIALTWMRRTRLGGDSWVGLDVPLNEEVEAYEIDVLGGADVKRTLSVSVTSATYTSADQIADFGSDDFPTLTLRIAQLSQAFGRGTEREATLHV